MILNNFFSKIFSISVGISKQIFKFFILTKLQISKCFIQMGIKSEDDLKKLENDFFNLLKQNEIDDIKKMNISYIQSYKVDNGKIVFKYPLFPLQYSNLNLDELPEEKVYYLKTLFNNFKLIDYLKQESNKIKYPHISIDYKNNIISRKSKRILIPFDREKVYQITYNKKIESTFQQINEYYEAYVSETYHMFKVGISVKLFRVLSLYINESNKEIDPFSEDNPYFYIFMYKWYFAYKYPVSGPLTFHMAKFFQYSIYDREKSQFFIYMPYDTAEECMILLYNLSLAAYDYLFIDPRDENEQEWFECDIFLEYIKLIRKYYTIRPQIDPLNPLEHSKLFSFYGYEFPYDTLGHQLRKC